MKSAIFSILTLLIVGTGTSSCVKTELPAPSSLTAKQKADFTNTLMNQRDAVKNWASTCENLPDPGHPHTNQMSQNRQGTCSQVDTNEHSGISCLAAFLANDFTTQAARCRDVQVAQTPDGRWYRGFTRIAIEAANCASGSPDCPEGDAFSRDAMNGLFAYWLVTKDSASATRWMNWVLNSDHGALCARPSDGRCIIEPDSWSYLYRAWTNMGLTPISQMNDPNLFMADYSPLSTLPPGFELTNQINEVVFLRQWNIWNSNPTYAKEDQTQITNALKSANSRQPLNPYYNFMANGVSQDLVNQVVQACPKAGPVNPSTDFTNTWAWDNADPSDPKTNPVGTNSMGHDCIFLMNLMIAALK